MGFISFSHKLNHKVSEASIVCCRCISGKHLSLSTNKCNKMSETLISSVRKHFSANSWKQSRIKNSKVTIAKESAPQIQKKKEVSWEEKLLLPHIWTVPKDPMQLESVCFSNVTSIMKLKIQVEKKSYSRWDRLHPFNNQVWSKEKK